MKRARILSAVSLAAAAALALSACGSAAEPSPQETPEPAASFPRTVEVPAARGGDPLSITIEHEPQAIAALDYESAEVIAELGLADRLVLIPEAVLNPALGGHIDELSEVENAFPVAADLDAEMVVSVAPDLVVMSPRHGAEDTIGSVLEQAGLTVLPLPSSWTSPDTLAVNIDLIGQATGADAEADELEQAIAEGLEAGAAEGATDDDRPRVLVLTNQAGTPFATAGQAFPLTLLDLAGGANVSDELGLERTGPISAEKIVESAPDGILLIDMNGTGDRMFRELLDNPAVASLPAASDDRLLLLTGRQVQALGLTTTTEGLASLTAWVAGLR